MNRHEHDFQELIESVEHEEQEAAEQERHAREAEQKYRAAVSLPRTLRVDTPPTLREPREG
jgi:hypothetical protein